MNCILASTSTIYGSSYLAYLRPQIIELFKNKKEILFIPYARPSGISFKEYTTKASQGLSFLKKTINGLQDFPCPLKAIESAEAIFIGGGNTFLLVKTLQDFNLLKVLKQKIEKGIPYLGTSAGSNIFGLTMQTTNDMPIVMPRSYQTLGVLPFNLNVHYSESNPNTKHKGESRVTRIKEFQGINPIPVLGLREGSWLTIHQKTITLTGDLDAVWFAPKKEPTLIKSGYIFHNT